MAIKIENFESFEINGKTYSGNFPVYASDAVCTKPSTVDYQNQLELDMIETNEDV
jgi:hypothetical protein